MPNCTKISESTLKALETDRQTESLSKKKKLIEWFFNLDKRLFLSVLYFPCLKRYSRSTPYIKIKPVHIK